MNDLITQSMEDVRKIISQSLWSILVPIILIIFFICTVLTILINLKEKKKRKPKETKGNLKDDKEKFKVEEYGNIRKQSEYNPEKGIRNLDYYKGKYQRRYILTQNEKNNYRKIKEVTDSLQLELFTKVRLADILEPKSIYKDEEWKHLFYKVDAKHVDFLVCLKDTLKMVCVIEIDDRSHEREDRIIRDKFVDFILKEIKIPTIRKYRVDIEELKIELIDLI